MSNKKETSVDNGLFGIFSSNPVILQAPNHSLLLETNGLPSFCLGVMERWVNVMVPLASWKMFVKVACLESWLLGKECKSSADFVVANLLRTLGMLIPFMQALCWKVEDESAPKFGVYVVFSTHAKHPAPYPVVVFFELIQMFWAHNPPPKKGESWECSNNMLASPHHAKKSAFTLW